MYKSIFRKLLFIFPPETVHKLVVSLIKFFFKIPGARNAFRRIFSNRNEACLEREVIGLKFSNPVGLAAGFDKNAEFFNEFSSFGFSFIEIGTVTPEPKPGNSRPRLFRLLPDNALVNRMGLNNKGVNYVKSRLQHKENQGLIIGGNIGKNSSTPNSNAVSDYIACFNELYSFVDYVAVNLSCPNVHNLSDLQNPDSVKLIIESLVNERAKFPSKKPILLKVSPDLSPEQLNQTIDAAEEAGVDGYIATNTTTGRNNLKTKKSELEKIGRGGLSGKPLRDVSTEVIRFINQKLDGKKPIIGVGGIFTPMDALEKLEAGASLVQVYTGFIYEGPFIVKRINKLLINKMFNTYI